MVYSRGGMLDTSRSHTRGSRSSRWTRNKRDNPHMDGTYEQRGSVRLRGSTSDLDYDSELGNSGKQHSRDNAVPYAECR